MFIGDVMGHGGQVRAAFDENTKTYSYDSTFSRIAPAFALTDLAIANLEVTLAGEPYSGYPQFSSPDALADGLKTAGIDALVTANNHSVDRGKNGIIRTIDVLNNRGIPFAGTYKDKANRDSTYPLLIEQNGIRVALLNYTYGTNGIPVPSPTIVNLIDTAQIRTDYQKAKAMQVDEVIAFLHWGNEYQRTPSLEQMKLTAFMHNLGLRIVIGSHPHVLQRMEASMDTDSTEGRVAVYSLGNFVSNQRSRYQNGGAMALIRLEKDEKSTRITHTGHILVWVHLPKREGRKIYQVLPVSQYEQISEYFSIDDEALFTEFAADSRKLYGRENYNFPEIHYRNGQWQVPWIRIDQELQIPQRIKRIVPWRKKVTHPKLSFKF
jgi:poly-gamma-glutamate synthesis protein (capsule biosynthesis protein)